MNSVPANLSKKQALFANYLLIKLGVRDPQLRSMYMTQLLKIYSKWNGVYWTASPAIDALLEETVLKKEIEKLIIKQPAGSIAATDLSHFTYCPASYAINKTFEITNTNGAENTEQGINFHQQLNLLKYINKENKSEVNIFSDQEAIYGQVNYVSGIPKEIANSKIVFCGHEAEKKYFTNGKLSGVPDYIFQNESGQYFVVEEKFHKKRDPNKSTYSEVWYDQVDEETETKRKRWESFRPTFFDNHIVQLVSYLKNVCEYNISYGYLLYWYYDLDYQTNTPLIHKTASIRMELNATSEALYKRALDGINFLNEEQKLTFDINAVGVEKCVSCVVGKYCGHKTRRYSELSFPYKKEYLKLFFAEFPAELKKQQQPKVPEVTKQLENTHLHLNIDGVKKSMGIPMLNMIRQLDHHGNKTCWLSHWEKEKRIRVTMHETVMKAIQADRSTILTLERQQVPRTKERDEYTRYIVHPVKDTYKN
jgi:hypothetical protein